jgi:hypothetical protein
MREDGSGTDKRRRQKRLNLFQDLRFPFLKKNCQHTAVYVLPNNASSPEVGKYLPSYLRFRSSISTQ